MDTTADTSHSNKGVVPLRERIAKTLKKYVDTLKKLWYCIHAGIVNGPTFLAFRLTSNATNIDPSSFPDIDSGIDRRKR